MRFFPENWSLLAQKLTKSSQNYWFSNSVVPVYPKIRTNQGFPVCVTGKEEKDYVNLHK